MTFVRYQKDPTGVNKLSISYTDFLATGETVASSAWTVPTGITNAADTVVSGTDAAITVSGGTEGGAYTLVNTITTNLGQTEQRSIIVEAVQK